MNSGPTLSLGSTGDDVKRLQRILVVTKLYDWTHIDGDFGPHTRDAVEAFQSSNGLSVDGIVGPNTWAALPADPGTPLLQQGATGSAVAALQKGLRTYSGGSGPTDPGGIDGDFGPHTEAAVKAYQTQRVVGQAPGASADGIVGDLTWFAPAGAAGATLATLAGVA